MSNSKYVGIDIHKATVVVCVIDENGKTILQSIIQTNGKAIHSFTKGLTGIIHLTFEEGTQAAWLYDLLKSLVAQLIVCDPRYDRKRYAASKCDKLDAYYLAQLLRTGSVTERSGCQEET